MAQLNFTISDANIADILEKHVATHPNIETNPDGSPKYTDAQWFKEYWRRQIASDYARSKYIIQQRTVVLTNEEESFT